MGDVADMELLVRGDQEMKERSPQKEEFQDLTFKKETVGNRKGSGKTKLDRAYKWILPLMVLAGLAIIAVTVIRVYKPSTSSRIGVKPGSLPVDRGHPKFPNFNRTRPVGFQVHTAEADSLEPWLHIRLPGDIQPVLYNISFFPDFYDERGQFFGNQTLEVNTDCTLQDDAL
ncbi:uncharacterized protein LOC101861634 [Aplysia californica]|uniref:Uncharacterized protein LOC101861634 n=1 Tax=Aplysia californica TaxID=6500 RepID=A0ABM1W1N4_APLCA|nr:uncharacterized protein LOC101861634 [Aplysia californica]